MYKGGFAVNGNKGLKVNRRVNSASQKPQWKIEICFILRRNISLWFLFANIDLTVFLAKLTLKRLFLANFA